MLDSLPAPLRQLLPRLSLIVSLVLALLGTASILGATSAPGSSSGSAASSSASSSAAADAATTTTAAATTAAPAPTTEPVADPAADSRAQLETLAIKGRAPKTGYSRDEFGERWSDDVDVELGHNGCDTRNDILARDLDNETIKDGTHGCVVLTGLLHDPYTGTDIDFQRGQSTSSLVQIDHVVPLSDAWQKGAQTWDAKTRRNFANDPRNLLAVQGKANSSKSDGDAATWLPANKSYRCTYAQKIIDVKAVYGLWVTQAEHDALAAQLDTCAA